MKVESPAQYKTIPPRSLPGPCTFEDLADFFVDYVINDQVGLVSHFHLQIADKSELHSMDPDCIKLAQLHAKAVDYRKTGQAVHRKEVPMPPFGSERPDFLAQRPAGPGIYPSTRALGQLYRAIPEERTDTPFGSQPGWSRAEGRQSALSNILKQPGKSDDVLTILSMLVQKYPQIVPEGLKLVKMQEHFRPLLKSFVYHLSKLAAWIPESRTETEWLSEEEILVGTQVMATKAKQLKRRQERLTASTSELFPILRAQMQLIAGDESVQTSTIRTMANGANKGKGKATGTQTSIPGKEPAEKMHFAGYTTMAQEGRAQKFRPKIVMVDGERVILREGPSTMSGPSPWSDDEDGHPHDIAEHLNRVRERFVDDALRRVAAAKESTAAAASSSSTSRTDGNDRNVKRAGNRNQSVGTLPTVNGDADKHKGKGKNKATPNGVSKKDGGASHINGHDYRRGKNLALACTDPELYQLMCSEESEESESDFDYSDIYHVTGSMTSEDIALRQRCKELRYLYAACYLGASEATTRHFGGNTFAVIALGCLLEQLDEHMSQGRMF